MGIRFVSWAWPFKIQFMIQSSNGPNQFLTTKFGCQKDQISFELMDAVIKNRIDGLVSFKVLSTSGPKIYFGH